MKLTREDIDGAKTFLQAALRKCEEEGMVPVGVCMVDPDRGDGEGDNLYYHATGPEEAMGVAMMLCGFAQTQIALHGSWCPGILPYAIDLAAYQQAKNPPTKGEKPPF